VLLAYCTGLIAVCTGLLIVATVFTVQNYWMLRRLSDGEPGKHDPEPRAVSETSSRGHSEHYDSGPPPADDSEWTGPVTTYTPAGRNLS
jgi:hypothetical protein